MHVDGFLPKATDSQAVEDNARKLKGESSSNMKVRARRAIMARPRGGDKPRIAEPQFQGQTKDVLGYRAGQTDRHPR